MTGTAGGNSTEVASIDTVEARWHAWRSEHIPRLDGDTLLARTEQRLRAFWQGDRHGEAPGKWPMTGAQSEAVRAAAAARNGPERLLAVASIIEASPYFDWRADADAIERKREADEGQGMYFSERAYRAFDRPDLSPGTYTKANAGLIGPKTSGRGGRAPPAAICADARGWAVLLWGHERNRWCWSDEDFDAVAARILSDDPRDVAWVREDQARRASREQVEVAFPAVGISFFTSLTTVNGGRTLNEAAATLLGLDETQAQWLGASAWEGGPYWDTDVTARDLADVCRAVAGGEDARDAWYARRIRGLDIGCDGGWRGTEEVRALEREATRGPELSGRLSGLIDQALEAAGGLSHDVYRPNARVLHRWNSGLERCELDIAGLLLAGPLGLTPHASADEAWLHVVDNPRSRNALRALRQASMGEVAEAVSTLGCFEHHDALEAMTVESGDYDGWREAEAHFKSLERLGQRVKALGL